MSSTRSRGETPATTRRRDYSFISSIEHWTLPFFRAHSGFCPTLKTATHQPPQAQQRKYRVFFVDFMRRAAHYLQLPFTTTYVAINLFDRFYFCFHHDHHQSTTDDNDTHRFSSIYDPYCMSLACLFVSGKEQETRIRLDRCARFLLDSLDKYHQPPPPPRAPQVCDTAADTLDKVCKRLLLHELLLMQRTRFALSDHCVHSAFDYLLPIATQWKHLCRCAHQTLRLYCRTAFRFLEHSFHTLIHVVIAPPQMALVAMELALRLHHANYVQQQPSMLASEQEQEQQQDGCRYLNPPLRWYAIFDASMTKHELELAVGQVVDGLGDTREFGVSRTRAQLELLLRSWRSECVVDMDGAHQQIIDHRRRQPAQERPHHQSVSPAMLHPRRFLNLYPLNKECFTDMQSETKVPAAQMPALISTISPTSPLEPNYAQTEGAMSTTHTSPNVNEDLSRTPASISQQPEDKATCSLLNELQQITSIKPEQIIEAVESSTTRKDDTPDNDSYRQDKKRRKRKRSKSPRSDRDDDSSESEVSSSESDSDSRRRRKKRRKIDRSRERDRDGKRKDRSSDRDRDRDRSHRRTRKRSPSSSSDRDGSYSPQKPQAQAQPRYNRNRNRGYAQTQKIKTRTRGPIRRRSVSSHAHPRKSSFHHRTYGQQQQQQQHNDNMMMMEIEYGLSDCNTATEPNANEGNKTELYSNMWIPTRNDSNLAK